MGSNVAVVGSASVVFATAWTDGRATAVNARPATNFALLLAARKYAPHTDIAIVDNAGLYNIALIYRVIHFNQFSRITRK